MDHMIPSYGASVSRSSSSSSTPDVVVEEEEVEDHFPPLQATVWNASKRGDRHASLKKAGTSGKNVNHYVNHWLKNSNWPASELLFPLHQLLYPVYFLSNFPIVCWKAKSHDWCHDKAKKSPKADVVNQQKSFFAGAMGQPAEIWTHDGLVQEMCGMAFVCSHILFKLEYVRGSIDCALNLSPYFRNCISHLHCCISHWFLISSSWFCVLICHDIEMMMNLFYLFIDSTISFSMGFKYC